MSKAVNTESAFDWATLAAEAELFAAQQLISDKRTNIINVLHEVFCARFGFRNGADLPANLTFVYDDGRGGVEEPNFRVGPMPIEAADELHILISGLSPLYVHSATKDGKGYLILKETHLDQAAHDGFYEDIFHLPKVVRHQRILNDVAANLVQGEPVHSLTLQLPINGNMAGFVITGDAQRNNTLQFFQTFDEILRGAGVVFFPTNLANQWRIAIVGQNALDEEAFRRLAWASTDRLQRAAPISAPTVTLLAPAEETSAPLVAAPEPETPKFEPVTEARIIRLLGGNVHLRPSPLAKVTSSSPQP